MDIVAETLDTKLHEWTPDIAEQVRHYILEIIDMADQDSLEIQRSRFIEQEVLDLLDENEAR